MGLLDKFGIGNPFAKYFKDVSKEEDKIIDQSMKNSQGVSELQLQLAQVMNVNYNTDNMGGVIYTGIQWENFFAGKVQRILGYRAMSKYPNINDAITMICDDAVVPDVNGETVYLDFRKEVPRHIEEQIRDLWNYLIHDVYAFNDRGWDMFRKWLIDSEMYVENILNEEGNNIIDIKILSPLTMMPIYIENKVSSFVQSLNFTNNNLGNISNGTSTNNSQDFLNKTFNKNQISYATFGEYFDGYDVRGYLESSIKLYNQLKNMEDAIVIYRLNRGTERRIWNIAIGKMPKGKAEEYIKGMIQKYKKRIIYDPETGAMDSSQNILALTEDYWFAKNEAGEGTTIDTIGGGINLGELEDIKYFVTKLNQTLQLPRSRWDDSAGVNYSSGKSGDMLKEELKFMKFIERLQRKFSYIIMDSFISLLRLRGLDSRYTTESLFNIRFNSANLFKQYKEVEFNESRLQILGTMNDLIYSAENQNGYFAPEFVLKNLLQFSEYDLKLNNDMLQKLKGASDGTKGKVEDEMGIGDMGGGFGGGMGGTEAPVSPEPETPTEEPKPEEGGGEITPNTEVAPESKEIEIAPTSKFNGLFTKWYNDKSIVDAKPDNEILNNITNI